MRHVSAHSFTSTLEGGEGSASRPGRILPPGITRYPSYRRLGGPHGWSERVRKISPPPGFFYASFVRILYFCCSGIGLGAAWSGWSFIGTESCHQELPSLAREDAAYWPDTQRTQLAKEGTNGICPAIDRKSDQ
jgi:hypothetical protein